MENEHQGIVQDGPVPVIYCGETEVTIAGPTGEDGTILAHDSSGRFTTSLGDRLVTVVTKWGSHEYYSWHSDVAETGGQVWYVIEPSGVLSIVSESMTGKPDKRGTVRAYAPGAWVSVEGWRGADPHQSHQD